MILAQVPLSKDGRWTAKTGALLSLALMCLVGGLRYSLQISGQWPPADAPGAFILLDQVIPLEVWGAWWLVSGLLCLAAALVPQGSPKVIDWCRRHPWTHYVEALAPASAFGIHLVWGLTYTTWWVLGVSPFAGGNPDSWRAGGLYVGVAALIWFVLIAGKKPQARRMRVRRDPS